ncbi:MAG: hypothetical protein ACI31A_02925 [Candidatus Limisoma sp.]
MKLVNEEGLAHLDIALKAWQRYDDYRRRRERNMNFTYGRQWLDPVQLHDGSEITEQEHSMMSGKTPSTNNLIRQLVKSVVGRFRSQATDSAPEDIADTLSRNLADEVDCRTFEEFLISGACFQRVEVGRSGVEITNVCPAQMFTSKITDSRGNDCRLVGQLHDMAMSDILRRLADGSRRRAVDICRALAQPSSVGSEFFTSGDVDRYRVVELWTLESRESYRCHDRSSGTLFYATPAEAKRLNESVERRWTIRDVWRCRWLTPSGVILSQYDAPMHPFVFKLYPLTDGEIHSFVEDVIDQQKFVNRMITIIDHVMDSTAKGVLIYPTESLPEGFSWQDLVRTWRSPNGVIPYDSMRLDSGFKPEQLIVNGANTGAYELLNLQMNLFEKISGVSAAMQGQNLSGVNGSKLYDSQVENSTISLLDLFDSFTSFLSARNDRIRSLIADGRK